MVSEIENRIGANRINTEIQVFVVFPLQSIILKYKLKFADLFQ